jgi:site-specific DNA recombinase
MCDKDRERGSVEELAGVSNHTAGNIFNFQSACDFEMRLRFFQRKTLVRSHSYKLQGCKLAKTANLHLFHGRASDLHTLGISDSHKLLSDCRLQSPSSPMRYFMYCRKSTEAEDRQVASIESQLTTLQRAFGARPEIEIVAVYEEAFSAKAPGRARFAEMLSRIENGDAAGIIAWAPDRLARNSIDGGRLIYMIDCGVIRDLKFATYTFENNSQGKFMLQIMFGQSKYYSDALSDNVKRGNRTKLDNGWRPNQAPLGYLNDKATRTIVKDPVHFPLVRKIFELMLTGAYSPRQIAIIARDEWGFLTPKKKRIGGRPLAMSTVYKMLSNPFYAGLIVWNGQTHPGKHEPVVSIDDFRAVRRLLERPSLARPKRYIFPFRGMIRCATCGLRVTPEHKINRYGYHYIYYHCSKRSLGFRCGEPSVTESSLITQIENFLRNLIMEPTIEAWLLQEIRSVAERERLDERTRTRSLEAALHSNEGQRNELTDLRLRGLLSDSEFIAKRAELQGEDAAIRQKLEDARERAASLEPFADFISFSNRAADWFRQGNGEAKRLILEIVHSNLSLKGKTLNIEAKKPFLAVVRSDLSPSQLTDVEDVRTFRTRRPKVMRLARTIGKSLATEEGQRVLQGIKLLQERFDPNTPAKAGANDRSAKAA